MGSRVNNFYSTRGQRHKYALQSRNEYEILIKILFTLVQSSLRQSRPEGNRLLQPLKLETIQMLTDRSTLSV